MDSLSTYLVIFISAFVAMIASAWAFPLVLQVARKNNVVDMPDARKLQKAPVPVLGGIAVAFGFFVGLLVGLVFTRVFGYHFILPSFSILSSIIIMLFLGCLDDVIGLSPILRFGAEILIVLCLIFGTGLCINSLHGLWGIQNFSWWIGVPLTVIACVGIINAVNMIDGVNGLSSSLCILNNLLFGIFFAKSGMLMVAIANFTMAGALVPFLIHNVIGLKSKMFIGDAGTMMMGVVMSYDLICLLQGGQSLLDWMQFTGQGMGLVALALAILGLPVADTLRVMTMRVVHHQSPFQADKTHLHHVLMEYSNSHTLTTCVEVLISFLIILTWLVAYLLGASIDVQFYVVLVATMLFVWGLYGYLSQKRKVRTGLAWRLRKMFARLRQGDSEWWMRLQERVDRH